jgi:hypothetical protein
MIRLLVLLPVVLFFVMAYSHFPYSPDDTYIYLQFAKNVTHGNGLSFNAGIPTYGFTSPLWLLIISAAGRLGFELLNAAKWLDLIVATCSVVAFYALARTVLTDPPVSLIATLAFSFNIWLIRWAATGMETSLSALIVILTFVFLLRRNYAAAGLGAGLLALTRPETFWLVALVAADGYLQAKDRRKGILNASVAAGTWALPVVSWYIFAWREFGTVLSNTARAKSTMSPDFADMVREFSGSVKILLASDGFALGVIAALVVVALRFRKKPVPEPAVLSSDAPDRRTLLLFSIWTVMVVVLYAVEHVLVVSRYLLLVSPFIGLLALILLMRMLNGTSWKRYARFCAGIVAACMIIQSQIIYRQVVAPGIEAFETGMESSLIPIGRWLKANTTERDVVLLWDIGAVGYYSDRTICDAAGLATPEMIQFAHGEDPLHNIVRMKLYREICPVTYIVHRAESPDALKGEPDLQAVLIRPFSRMGLSDFETRYYTVYKVTGKPAGQ